MFEKLKQFKGLRDQAKKLQNELAQETIHHDWKGRINMIMDGNQKIVAIEVDREMLREDKKEDLEKGLKECFNDSVKKAQIAAARKMQSSGGLSGMGMPRMGV